MNYTVSVLVIVLRASFLTWSHVYPMNRLCNCNKKAITIHKTTRGIYAYISAGFKLKRYQNTHITLFYENNVTLR